MTATAAAALLATVANAQTATDNRTTTVPGDTQQSLMVPQPTVVNAASEQDFLATLMWLVPLIIALLVIVPLYRDWNIRRHSLDPLPPRI
jgi:hypothetical protein